MEGRPNDGAGTPTTQPPLHRQLMVWLAAAMVAAAVLLVGAAATADEHGQEAQVDLAPTAEAALLMDPLSGEILYEKDADEPREPASITKVMTLMMALEAVQEGRAGLADEVLASPEVAHWNIGTQIWLEPGDRLTLRDLLMAIALSSANDASVAVAAHVAGSHDAFVQEMNRRAEELGMTGTTFLNAHGLPAEGHVTTARDVAVMAQAALLDTPEITEFTSVWMETLWQDDPERSPFELANTNKLLVGYTGVDGLKTGWTEAAGHSLVATAQRSDTRLVAVVMGVPTSDARFDESAAMLSYGFGSIQSHRVARKGQRFGRVYVEKGAAERVDAVAPQPFGVTLPRGEAPEVSTRLEPHTVEAPVAAGEVVAELVVAVDGEDVRREQLVAARDVQRAGLGGLFTRVLKRMWPFGQLGAR